MRTNSTTAHIHCHIITFVFTHNSADELDWIRAFSSTVVDAVEAEEACAAVDTKRKRRPHENVTSEAQVQQVEHAGASSSAGT
jgi:hypothetical protein